MSRSEDVTTRVVARLDDYDFDRLTFESGSEIRTLLRYLASSSGEVTHDFGPEYPALKFANIRAWLENFRVLSSGANGVITDATVKASEARLARNHLVVKTTTVCDPFSNEACTDSLAYEFIAMIAASEIRKRGYPYVPLPFALGYDRVRVQLGYEPRSNGDGEARVWVTQDMYDADAPDQQAVPMLFMERFAGGLTYYTRIESLLRQNDKVLERWILLDIMQFCVMCEAGLYSCALTHYDASPNNVMMRPLRKDSKFVLQEVEVGDLSFAFPSDGIMTFIDLGRAHVNGIPELGREMEWKRSAYRRRKEDLEDFGVFPEYCHPMFDVLMFVFKVLRYLRQMRRMTPRIRVFATQFFKNYPARLQVENGMYVGLSYRQMQAERQRLGSNYWTRPAHVYEWIMLRIPGMQDIMSSIPTIDEIRFGSGAEFPHAKMNVRPGL